MIAKLITENSIVVYGKGKTHTIAKSHVHYDKIKSLLLDPNFDDYPALLKLIDVPTAINAYGKGKVLVKDGTVYYENEPMHNALTTRIISMLNEGFDINPMVKFLENLMDNPSARAVNELYGFLEASSLPITDDGHFLAYKKVKKDILGNLWDIYTGQISNNVGEVVSKRRNQVNEDKDQTCSYGLHFCSQSYLPHFGTGPSSTVVIVKINPADVVSIPTDYNNAKGRCCRYVVVEEYLYEDYNKAFTSVVDTRYTQPTVSTKSEYDKGYAAGKAKASRHNKKGFGYIEKVNSDFGEGYWDGYHDYVKTDLPRTEPKVAKTVPLRGPNGRFVSKVQETTTEPQKLPKRGPDGRFLPKDQW